MKRDSPVFVLITIVKVTQRSPLSLVVSRIYQWSNDDLRPVEKGSSGPHVCVLSLTEGWTIDIITHFVVFRVGRNIGHLCLIFIHKNTFYMTSVPDPFP